MSVKELVGRLIILGGLGVGGYMLYNMVYVEPITRNTTVVEPLTDEEIENNLSDRIDDCARFVNADAHEACIEKKTGN